MTLELVADIVDELMGQVEDENGRVLDGVVDGGVGDEVVGEGDAGEVFDVFVVVVDDAGELLGL